MSQGGGAPRLEVRDLSVWYARAHARALDGVSFVVQPGEMLLVMGPSGSGKSTLGLCLAGLIPQSIPAGMQGTILLDGVDAASLTIGERTARIGMVFQDPEAQFCMLTVEDEVAFGLENLAIPRKAMGPRIVSALETVGLGHRQRERVDRLSGGQKQRLAVACALAREPEVLFLDEPTANLDPAARSEFVQTLSRLRATRRDLVVIIVEHVLDDLIDMVDRVLVLGADGRRVTEGPPRQVLDRHTSELDSLGIWLPQVTALAHKLRLAGLSVPDLPLNVEEAARAFAPLLVARCGPPATRRTRRDNTSPALAARGLRARYEQGPEVLHAVNLDVPTGGFCALVGPNAAGKSTLAAHMVGIRTPEPGQVALFGDDITGLTVSEVTARVGYVFQNPEHQFVEQRVEDELAYSLRLRGRPPEEIDRIVTALLGSFGLEEYRSYSPYKLSQGQKRRLSVATMLAVGQRALVLDEPTFGQDRHTAHALMHRLLALQREGVTLLTITHDMQMVADYTERAVVLVDGSVIFAGTTAELFARPDVLEAAALRPPPLHALARVLELSDSDGNLPLRLRDWYPCFGVRPANGQGGTA